MGQVMGDNAYENQRRLAVERATEALARELHIVLSNCERAVVERVLDQMGQEYPREYTHWDDY